MPDEVASEGLLSMRVPTAERVGGGVRLLASNPHGDPDPSAPGANANVDRLAMAGDVWGRRGSWRSWASWRSDLHVDASISDRTKAVAEGLSFPTSVSFSGGAAWRPEAGEGLEVAVRHAPQLLLWMPHLSSERTAGATVGKGVFEHRGAALELEGGRIRAIAGRTVDPLSHFRGVFTGPSMRRFRLGFEHERLTTLGDVDARTRLVLGMDGPVRLRVGAGSDLVVQMDREGRSGRWVTSGRAWMRSRPEPLHLDELLRRGWSTETAAVPAPGTGWLGGAHVVVGRGPLALEVRGLFHEPVWTPATVSRADGGWVEATWADTVSFVELKGRARLASWGPETAWWNEAPSVSGRAGAHGDLGPARIRGWVQFRSRIRSDRSQRSEPAGFELGLGTDVPLPDLGSSRGITARMELDDVLDVGLPLRPGAPRRGRRLTVVLTWDLTGAP